MKPASPIASFLPVLAALAAFAALPAASQGFSAFASPSRFEVTAKAGETQRLVLEIQHVGAQPGRFRIYTTDWDLKADNSIDFFDELRPGSCRPWVALERRELTISPNGKYRFRFEIAPPADAKAGECRFAIMVEGAEPTRVKDPRFSFPVNGRLAVVVYATLGGSSPKFAIGASRVGAREGEQLPLVEVRNEGDAHGRLEGFLSAKDASGREFEMYPEDSPILPGRRREIALRPVVEDGKTPPPIKYPLAVKGSLEWGGKRESFERRFAP